jgi:hypothetical protein
MTDGWTPISEGGAPPSPPPRPTSDGPKKPDRTALYVIGGVVGVVLLCCGGLGGLGAYIASTAPVVQPEDRAGVINAFDVYGWVGEGAPPDAAWEALDIGPSVLGSREWDYEYEAPEGPEQYTFVSSSRSDESTVSEARSSFSTLKMGADFGVRVLADGVELQDASELLTWGDEQYFARMVAETGAIGHVVLVRRGKTVLFAVFGVVVFEDAEAVEAFLVPVLERAAGYRLPERVATDGA